MAGKGIQKVDRSTWRIFRDRAESFLQAVQYLVDDPASFRDALGSVSVHSAICFADAILVKEVGVRGTDQHQKAHKELTAYVSAKKHDDAGLKALKWLLSRKSAFEYNEKRASLEDAKMAADKCQQFAHWAYNTFPALVPEPPDREEPS